MKNRDTPNRTPAAMYAALRERVARLRRGKRIDPNSVAPTYTVIPRPATWGQLEPVGRLRGWNNVEDTVQAIRDGTYLSGPMTTPQAWDSAPVTWSGPLPQPPPGWNEREPNWAQVYGPAFAQRTAEEVAEQRRRIDERQEKIQAANDRARELLYSYLDAEQRVSWETNGNFVKEIHGKTYSFTNLRTDGVYLLDEQGTKVESYCFGPECCDDPYDEDPTGFGTGECDHDDLPMADVVLAQMLLIEGDFAEFKRIANVFAMRLPFRARTFTAAEEGAFVVRDATGLYVVDTLMPELRPNICPPDCEQCESERQEQIRMRALLQNAPGYS